MNRELILILLLLIFSGCSAQEKEEQIKTIPISEMKTICNNFCEVNDIAYCQEARNLKISEEKITIGTCRSFSKFNPQFTKCKGFCNIYGSEKGCILINQSKDKDCNGY